MHLSSRPVFSVLIPRVCIVTAALLTLLTLIVIPVTAQPATPAATTIHLPSDIGLNVKDPEFGAVGDGVADDTAAIQAALDKNRGDTSLDYYGRPKTLYFPPGTYRISNTLRWNGCCVLLQGSGSGQTVIRLADNTPAFANPNNPKAMIRTPAGNMSFRQDIFDMTIDTGSGNPGAVGLDYISNNWGALRGLVIRSGDGNSAIGLSMTRQWPGPLLVRDVQISGFAVGIDVAHAEYGPTFEDVTLSDMSSAGIRNDGNTLAIRRLSTNLAVPAILSTKQWSSLVVLDSSLSGGSGAHSAIETEGDVFVRNLTTSGYASALRLNGNIIPGSSHTEYVAEPIITLGPTEHNRSLRLPVKEVPAFHDNNLDQWVRFQTPNGQSAGQNRTALQQAFNSGKSTVYFAGGVTLWGYNEPLVVPPHVRRIVAYGHALNTFSGGVPLTLRIEDNSAEPLIIEGFGYGMRVEHRGGRTLVLKHGGYHYTDFPGAGELFLDDVGLNALTFQHTPAIWARQLNTEGDGDTPRIINNGTQLWILGIKTEGQSTVLSTLNGGRTELFGTLIYPSRPVPDGRPMFINSESDMSAVVSWSSYVNNGMFPVLVRETRYGVTRELPLSAVSRTLPLYVGTRPALPSGEWLVNGGSELDDNGDRVPDGWRLNNGQRDRMQCNRTVNGVERIFAHSGNCAFQLKAVSGWRSILTQRITGVDFSSGTVTLSAQVRGKNLSGVRVFARIFYTDGQRSIVELERAAINAGTYDYKPLLASGPLGGPVSRIVVKVLINGGTGKLLIDDISLNISGGAAPLPLPQP